MKYVLIGIIVVIALLAWVLNRRGTTDLSSNGSTDSEGGALGHQRRSPGPGGGGV